MAATFRDSILALSLVLVAAASASADTLLMPKRDATKGQPVVVWGVTTLANGTPFTLDYGDGTTTSGTVVDRSYIAFAKTYNPAEANKTYTVKLTVGVEEATVEIRVLDPAALPGGVNGEAARALKINSAIENGLRYLWTSQGNRAANFPTGTQTFWNGNPQQWTALVATAFQNHGYRLPADGSAPTGVYERFIVQRALNYVITNMQTQAIQSQAANPGFVPPQPVRDPCVGAIANPCSGLRPTSGNPGYGTGIAMLPIAASGVLSKINTAGAAAANMTYLEILQRLSNALAWGQTDQNVAGRGGWGYNLNNGNFDGSTVGWALIGLMDAEAAGVVVPQWVKDELSVGLTKALNNDGSLDYQGDGNPNAFGNVNLEKAGVGLQGMFFIGEVGSARAELTTTYISNRWNSGRLGSDYTGWGCGAIPNRGCGYAMFNNFKGLKLQGITTLPGVTRPAGPGAIPAGDWYADYQDWLVANQTNPNATNGGQWNGMRFGPIATNVDAAAALAELILSPVALVLPDADKFKTVGLSPSLATAVEGEQHTVTAKAESEGGTPVAGATVNFEILSGPNAGLTFSGVTNAAGQVAWTYTDAGPIPSFGTDRIIARIGTLESNIAEMVWTPFNRPPAATDNDYSVNEDGTLNGNVVTDAPADSDPDNDELSASVETGVSHGTLDLLSSGAFTYTPAPDYCGPDSFTYSVNDGMYDSDVATVDITVACVNDPPSADDGSATTDEDTPVAGAVTSSDTDGAAPVYSLAGNGAGGSAAVNADGSFVYTPNANFCGTDSFTFSVSDGTDTDTGTVTVTVNCVNDPPVADDSSVTTAEDTPLAGAATSSDVDGPGAAYAVATGPAHGTLTLNADGSYVYTPALNYNGPDSFTFTVDDGAGGSDGGEVSISVTPVNDMPVCTAAGPSVASLWPPNHELVDIDVLGVTDPVEQSAITINVTGIFQDEPTDTIGDGNTLIDGFGVGTSIATVRRERSGSKKVPGDGRMYYIYFTGTDADGGQCTGVVQVGVPHDLGKDDVIGAGGPLYKSTGQ